MPLRFLKRELAKTSDDELKAKLLFATAKCEQGLFYQNGVKQFEAQFKGDNYDEDHRTKELQFKIDHYTTYFQKLKHYSDTDYFDTVKRNCKYFNYYVLHY